MTTEQSFLTAILECGINDLSILREVNYVWEDILDQMDFPDCHKFNDVIRAIFDLGIIDIKDWIASRLMEPDISVEERSALSSLNPDTDIEAYCNYLASKVSFRSQSKIYHQYCKNALEHFHDMTGYVING